MKKILAIALAVATICGGTAAAQCNKAQQCQGQPAQVQPAGDNNKMYQPREFTDFAFEGILLDVNQQAAIDTINAKYKAKMEAGGPRRGHGQKPMRGNKPCQQPNCPQDTIVAVEGEAVACDAPCPGEKPGNCMAEYIQEVKTVLTPEQYTQFLENIVTNCPGNQPKMHGQRGPRAQRDGARMVAPQGPATEKGQKDGQPRQQKGKKGNRQGQDKAQSK